MSSHTETWVQVAGGVRAEMARAQRNATELMPLLNLSRNSIYRRLNAEVPFDLAEIHKVASLLGVTVESFYMRPIPAEAA